MATLSPVGVHLRDWRQRRKLSQLDLACDADISARHLSFVETGRAQPSRDMLLRLADQLDIPLRDRNALLLAAGYAPLYSEQPLDAHALAAVREAVSLVLEGHEPYPALAVDRHWTMVAANAGVTALLGAVDASLLAPPVNVLRLSLHPLGLAPRIGNLGAWRDHLLHRLHRQVRASGDAALHALLAELEQYPAPHGGGIDAYRADVFVPLQLQTDAGTLTFLSTTTVFGTPLDVTVSELAIEAFFPADAATVGVLRRTYNSDH